MGDFVVNAIEALGAFGVGLLMLLENVFPPIPSEVVMPLAGYLSSQDRLPFAAAVVAGTLGSALGAGFWYVLGRRLGRERMRAWAGQHGHWLGLAAEDVDDVTDWFERHGYAAVFFGRLVPGVRSFISLPAGFQRMSLLPFALFTLLGSAIWTLALAWIGQLVGREFEQVGEYVGPVSWVVIGVLLVLYLRRVWRRQRAD